MHFQLRLPSKTSVSRELQHVVCVKPGSIFRYSFVFAYRVSSLIITDESIKSGSSNGWVSNGSSCCGSNSTNKTSSCWMSIPCAQDFSTETSSISVLFRPQLSSTPSWQLLSRRLACARDSCGLNNGRHTNSSCFTRRFTSAGRDDCELGPGERKLRNTSDLLKEGFTDKQAARILSYLAAQKRKFNLENVQQWLLLLHTYNVQDPVLVVANHCVVLPSMAGYAKLNAPAVVHWMSSMQLSPKAISLLLAKNPMLLVLPHATVAAAAAWFSSELDWSSSMIAAKLSTTPTLFGSNPVLNLAPKMAWFNSKGLSNAKMSKVLFNTPALLNFSIARNKCQISALRASGLSETDVDNMVRKKPQILTSDIAGAITQTKLRFLTQEMGQPIHSLVNCPVFITLSLLDRIGPRWFFFSLYCQGQTFILNSQLKVTNSVFVTRLRSPSLDAECATHGQSRLQRFEVFMSKWQQNEGRAWDVKPQASSAELADSSSENGVSLNDDPDDAHQ